MTKRRKFKKRRKEKSPFNWLIIILGIMILCFSGNEIYQTKTIVSNSLTSIEIELSNHMSKRVEHRKTHYLLSANNYNADFLIKSESLNRHTRYPISRLVKGQKATIDITKYSSKSLNDKDKEIQVYGIMIENDEILTPSGFNENQNNNMQQDHLPLLLLGGLLLLQGAMGFSKKTYNKLLVFIFVILVLLVYFEMYLYLP